METLKENNVSKEREQNMFQAPTMKDVKPSQARGESLPRTCDVIVEVSRTEPRFTRAKKSAVIPYFEIVEVLSQDLLPERPGQPAKDGAPAIKARAAEMPLEPGQIRTLYFEFGGEWGFGEAEWALLLQACGFPTEEQDAAQQLALGADNILAGKRLHIKRYPSVSSKGAHFTALVIEPAEAAAA